MALLAAGPAPAAEAFPSRPVHVLVPFPAGGAVDIVARTLGDELSRRWGQSVIIENRPGAGGTIAAAAEAKAAPDGYTLILVASGHAIVAHLYPALSYDPLHDFTPLSLVASSPNMLLVRADSRLTSIADVLALARAKPGALSYGHAGNGTSPHLAGELLKYMAKVDIAAVPYKGGAPALNDLLGGHIPLSFNNIPESIAQVRAGAVRALGVTTAVRSPVLPEVPTIPSRACRATTPASGGASWRPPACRSTSRPGSRPIVRPPCRCRRCASGCSRSERPRSAAPRRCSRT
jgi:tripartite-type tricarboxylate transporter receptor subunit TctC